MRKTAFAAWSLCILAGMPLFAACEKYSIVGKCTLRDETKKLVEFDGADVFFTLKDDGKWASPFRVMGYKRGAVAYSC